MSFTIINGEISEQIYVADRGLHYGDGLFETIAIKNHQLLFWHDHLHRMSAGCKQLNLPMVAEHQWLDDIRALNIQNTNAVVKLIITRGCGGRGYKPANSTTVTRIVAHYPWPDYSDDIQRLGIKSIFCNTRATINSTLAGLKHINKLENVLARNEWNDDSIREGLMLNDELHVIEGTMSNLFAINNDVLYTPLLNKSGVNGVLRENIIKLATANNIDLEIIDLTKPTLINMDEIFITNSVFGIWPVTELEGKRFSIGSMTAFFMDKLDMTAGAQII